MTDLGWRDRAACLGHPTPDIFFAPDREEPRHVRKARETDAKAVCATCPVIMECRMWAVETGMTDGVWGGKTGAGRSRWAGRHGLVRHGTRTGYDRDGCRCDICRGLNPWGRFLRPCGTAAAYQRHLRAGEEACGACKYAHMAQVRRSREG